MELGNAIIEAKKIFGENVIYESRLISIIDDLGAFRTFPASKYVIRELINNNLLISYYSNDASVRDRITQMLTTRFGFDAEVVKKVFIAFDNSFLSNQKQNISIENRRLEVSDNTKTSEIIFIIDASRTSYSCYNSMSFFIKELVKELDNNITYLILHYNDISIWDIRDSATHQSLSIPYISFSGENDFNQALQALCDTPIDWSKQKYCPILIWLVGSNIVSDYQNNLNNLIDSDILFNKAWRIAIYFGNSVAKDSIEPFAPYHNFSSIGFDEIITTINTLRHTRIINIDASPLDKDVQLLNKKINNQLSLLSSPQLFIEKKYKQFSHGIFACKKNGKWGWIGLNGEQVIPFQYETIRGFYEGLAAISSKGTPQNMTHGMRIYIPAKWGFINFLGQQVIEEVYDNVSNFSHGIALVEQEDKWGVINMKGELIIPCEFSSICYASDSILRVEKRVLKSDSHEYVDKYGYYTIAGEKITDCIYDFASHKLKDNKSIVKVGNRTYLLNDKGRRIAHIPYFTAEFTANDSLLLFNRGWINRELLYGLCSLDGTEIVPDKYEKIHIDNDSTIIFTKGKGFVDYYSINGNKINTCQLIVGFKFIAGYAIVQKTDKKWYKMDSTGNFSALPYSNVYYVFGNGNALIKYNNHRYLQIIDIKGALIRTYSLLGKELSNKYSEYPEYMRIDEIGTKADRTTYWFNKLNGAQIAFSNMYHERNIHKIYNGYVIVSNQYDIPDFMGGSKRYMYTTYTFNDLNTGREIGMSKDTDGHLLRKEFELLGEMSENRMAFKKNCKWGFIDSSANEIIPAIFDSVESFRHGMAIVCKDRLYGIIDLNGNYIVNLQYQGILFLQRDIYGEL